MDPTAWSEPLVCRDPTTWSGPLACIDPTAWSGPLVHGRRWEGEEERSTGYALTLKGGDSVCIICTIRKKLVLPVSLKCMWFFYRNQNIDNNAKKMTTSLYWVCTKYFWLHCNISIKYIFMSPCTPFHFELAWQYPCLFNIWQRGEWEAPLHYVPWIFFIILTVLLQSFSFIYFCFSVDFWTVVAIQRPSRRLNRNKLFCPFNGTEHGSPPSLTTRDRELVII